MDSYTKDLVNAMKNGDRAGVSIMVRVPGKHYSIVPDNHGPRGLPAEVIVYFIYGPFKGRAVRARNIWYQMELTGKTAEILVPNAAFVDEDGIVLRNPGISSKENRTDRSIINFKSIKIEKVEDLLK